MGTTRRRGRRLGLLCQHDHRSVDAKKFKPLWPDFPSGIVKTSNFLEEEMATLAKKSFDNDGEVITPEKTYATTINFGSVAATKLIAQPGWKWSECIKPVVGTESCQAGHVGMVAQGTLHVVSDDGSEITVTAGDAYSFAPGHDAWVVGDEEFIAYEFNNSGKDYAVWQTDD